jgi:preprotein translocase subunit SecF
VVLASLLIAIYIIYQFKDRLFGICALLATVHDSLVILGTFSLLGHFFGIEVDTLFVTAVLTVLSFSVHDTIVVYDRIREKIRLSGVAFSGLSVPELESVVDSATNETLVRSLNNSLTVIFMLTALSILGGDSIRWFAAALLIGTISGSYSSPFVAGPLLIVFKRLQNRLAKR